MEPRYRLVLLDADRTLFDFDLAQAHALEAAAGCKKYALEVLKEPKICSIIRDNNTASIHVAERNGLKPAGSFVKHYYGIEMPHIIYSN